MRRQRGSIQARRGKWRISWYDVSGVRQYETWDTKQEAERELAKRIADTLQGAPASSKPNTVLVEELARDVITDYGFNEYKTTSDQEARFRLHLLPFFGRRKAQTITTADVKAYHEWRKKQGASLGTIARELQLFKHTLTLAKNSSPPKILIVPYIPIPEEKNVRQGFLERDQFEALLGRLVDYLRPVAWFGYITRWRLNEVLSRRWRHVNFELGEVVMEQYETKSGKGRTFPMVDELRQLLESIRPEKCFPNDLIFQRNGQSIKRFDKAWATACYKAGLPVRYIEKKVLIDPKDPAKGKRVVLYKNGPKKG